MQLKVTELVTVSRQRCAPSSSVRRNRAPRASLVRSTLTDGSSEPKTAAGDEAMTRLSALRDEAGAFRRDLAA